MVLESSQAVRRGKMPKQSQVFFFLILGAMLFFTWLVFRDFLIYIITAIFVAVLALPIDKFWEKFFPNRIAAICTMTTLFVIMTVPLLLLGAAMYKDATRLGSAVQSNEILDLVNHTVEKPWAQNLLNSIHPEKNVTLQQAYVAKQVHIAQNWTNDQLNKFGTELIQAAPEAFVGLTVILFVVYYVLTDGETFVAYLRRAAPLPGRQIDFLLHEARQGLSAVFMGQILVSLLQGFLGGLGFFFFGLPNAVLWGAVMAILALLPVVGTFLVWLPAGLYLILQGHVWAGVGEIAWGAIVVMIIVDTAVRPVLIGSRADIHPMLVLVGVLGGAAAFGFIGLFLGPLIVGVMIAVLKVYEADYLDPEVNLLDEYVHEYGGGGGGTGTIKDNEPADPDTAPSM